jgi:uncharacterized protein YueI
MITPNFYGFIKDGTLTLIRPEDYRKYLMSLSGRVILSVRKERVQRSKPQNDFYWAVVVKILSEHFGYTRDEMHDVLKNKFLQKKDLKHPDFILTRSTTALSTKEFILYIDTIVQWAAEEFSIVIPPPNDVDYRD